jgi:hypothetical protein
MGARASFAEFDILGPFYTKTGTRVAAYEHDWSMTKSQLLITIGLLLSVRADHGDPIGAYVPTSPEAQPLGGVRTASKFPDNLVRVVGTAGPRASAGSSLSSAGGTDYPIRNDSTPCEPNSIDATVPFGALWPDKNDTIVVKPRNAPNELSEIRNPWEIRSSDLTSRSKSTFKCGGTIVGGVGGAVAFVNDRIVRRGDIIGAFEVASVVSVGIVLEKSGSYLVVPRGRCIIVKSASD